MKAVGLFFGTYNPIHVGHMIIANHIVENTDLDEVWLVVTPLNPHKNKSNLLDKYHRLEMVRLATEDYHRLKGSDIEFNLPQPNYTIDTLSYLAEKFPGNKFSIIIGEDNLRNFHKWKNYKMILEYYSIYLYPRVSEPYETEKLKYKNVIRIKAPKIEISSSHIRDQISKNLNVRPLLSEKVWAYLDKVDFYKKKTH